MFFQRPPNNNRVALYVDGFQVPPSGLFSVPTLPFQRPEPYRIKSGVNDLLYVRIGFNTPQLVQLIPGNTLRASDLAKNLAKKIPNLNWNVKNKRVVVTGPPQGMEANAFSFPDPRWTDKTQSLPSTAQILGAYETLGIVPGRNVTSKQLFPGWGIERDPTSPDETGKIIHFESPLFNDNPLIQLSYVTDLSNCRRCHGTQIEFDYSIVNHTYEAIDGTDLLSQEFDKFLITKIGSHFKWNWLGSGLVNRIGAKGSTAIASINSLITLDVSTAFRNYQNIKQQQDQRFPFQQVDDAEYPLNLAGINVQISPQDPTIAIVTTTIVSRSREPIVLKRIIGNPSPFTILGNPQAFLKRG